MREKSHLVLKLLCKVKTNFDDLSKEQKKCCFSPKNKHIFSAWMQLHTKEEKHDKNDKNQVVLFTVTC